jgi:hypothetical protein
MSFQKDVGLVGKFDYYIFTLYELWLWLMAATDIQIATVLTFTLKNLQTGFNTQTDDVVGRIIKTALQCALLPALFSVSASIMYAVTWSLSVQRGYPILIHAVRLLEVLQNTFDVLTAGQLRDSRLTVSPRLLSTYQPLSKTSQGSCSQRCTAQRR